MSSVMLKAVGILSRKSADQVYSEDIYMDAVNLEINLSFILTIFIDLNQPSLHQSLDRFLGYMGDLQTSMFVFV